MSEQFEHNIRKKLQDAEVPFEPMAWERMEKMLDGPRNRRPLFWWLSGLVLFLGISGWWYFATQTVDNPMPASKNEVTGKNAAAKQNEKTADNTEPTNNTGSAQANVISQKPSANAKLPAGNYTSPSLENGNATSGRNRNVNKATDPAELVSSTDKRVPGRKSGDQLSQLTWSNSLVQRGYVNKLAPTLGNETGKTGNEVLDTNSVDNQKVKTSNIALENNSSKSERGNVDKPVLPIVNTAEKDKKISPPLADANKSGNNQLTTPVNVDNTDTNLLGKNKRDTWKAPRRKGFEGGIHLGPDVNTTRSFTSMRTGFTGGLLLRYHVNNRVYFSTGAAYTKKLYKATPKEYNTPYPGNYTKIDADCDVIDVPVNIHYVFADGPAGRWNVSAGVSTYFMLREKYDYYYPNYYKRTRVFSNQNQHYFSVLNISAGWEKNTKGRVNWGLQPYVKIPLGGVGEGEVKLYSAGLSLQVTMGKK